MSKLTALTVAFVAALFGNAAAQSCPDASRFGSVSISPSTLSPGETYTVSADLTCAVQLGYTPTYLDYYIVGSASHTISGPILVARHTYDSSTNPPADTFTAVLPDWYYFTDATYSFQMVDSFAQDGPSGDPVITSGSISIPMNITGF
ncbi:hypothetical protein HMN09_00924400 [Mycena chlorophos]|uniref:Spore coat protein U domain-containing protein n=1 Tax=Mycena chlorophos TaxID=658473 RepID=A0A8H6W0E7_MYCCL|nr:hypothetical protein HMN09_00924400 [Mycena chlorophos]